jgi:hypothetical protein
MRAREALKAVNTALRTDEFAPLRDLEWDGAWFAQRNHLFRPFWRCVKKEYQKFK